MLENAEKEVTSLEQNGLPQAEKMAGKFGEKVPPETKNALISLVEKAKGAYEKLEERFSTWSERTKERKKYKGAISQMSKALKENNLVSVRNFLNQYNEKIGTFLDKHVVEVWKRRG